ncbi:MAG: 3-deoxy-D-manno-octulosonic acid transferase, partial [Candidatus Brocadiia bacterium]
MIRHLLDAIYAVVLFWISPLWLLHIPRAPRYRAGLLQRLGVVPVREGDEPCLWIHCASVGEAAIPSTFVERFAQRHPEWNIVLSTCTNTGARRLEELYPDCRVIYWPLDISFCVDAALQRVRPSLVLLVEQEMWPNFLLGCREQSIPVGVINGRIGEGSARFVRCLARLLPPVLDPVQFCCARSDEDARRYCSVGLDRGLVRVSGSLKYESLPDGANEEGVKTLEKLFAVRDSDSVLVAGSTHDGEEVAVATIWRRLRGEDGNVRLIVAPRHIERAAQVAGELEEAGFRVARKTEIEETDRGVEEDEIILVDTIGDLVDCYGLATCVFVGRSLYPPGGGQNMMEPAALGRPVIVGPHTGNFEPEMQVLRRENAVIEVDDEEELMRVLRSLIPDCDRRDELSRNARRAIEVNKGAVLETLRVVENTLRGCT